MIIVRLSGGLGNQLFQLAFGYQLAFRLKCEVNFTTHNLGPTSHRPLVIDKLISNLKIVDFKRDSITIQPNNKLKRFIYSVLGQSSIPIYRESKLGLDTYLIQKDFSEGYFMGNWTSFKYFEFCESHIKKEILFGIESLVSLLKPGKNHISVHVRRTDFLENDLMNVCTLEFYDKAINYFQNLIENCVFYFFSDDMEWVKKNFIHESFRYSEGFGINPLDDFMAMQQFENHIVSNSSYSWWAAYLGVSVNKIIVCPDRVLRDRSFPVEDYFPSSWIKIPL